MLVVVATSSPKAKIWADLDITAACLHTDCRFS